MSISAVVKNQFRQWIFLFAAFLAATTFLYAQEPKIFALTAQSFEGGKAIALDDLR